MTLRDQTASKVEARRDRERRRVIVSAAERRRAMDAKRAAERRLAMAALAGELSEREVAAIAGVSRSTLRSWCDRGA
jgi:hypothetical protein